MSSEFEPSGAPTPQTESPFTPRWKTLRLILGILMLALVLLILFQSCAAGIGDALLDNGETGGSTGLVCGLLFLAAGVTGVATRSSAKKGGPIAVCVLCWLIYLCSRLGAGSYGDLKVWGIVAWVFGSIYLISAMKKGVPLLVSSAVSIVYLVLGLI